jgi:hypothetical protein
MPGWTVQHPDLLAGQVGLDLVKELEIETRICNLFEHVAEVFDGHDVVDRPEAQAVIASRELADLCEQALRRLGPELHGRAVQAAESAMLLLAPPAPAGGFDRYRDLRSLRRIHQP